jgi:hypothetical protein
MRAIAKVNVSRAGFVPFDEHARARTGKRMTRFVVLGQVGFGLDDLSGAASPNQLGADKLACTRDGIAPKESCPNDSVFHGVRRERESQNEARTARR